MRAPSHSEYLADIVEWSRNDRTQMRYSGLMKYLMASVF